MAPPLFSQCIITQGITLSPHDATLDKFQISNINGINYLLAEESTKVEFFTVSQPSLPQKRGGTANLIGECGANLEVVASFGAGEGDNADKLKVVATTTIVGDVVSQVGGDHIDLSVLLPVGADPHSFDPTPQDIVKLAETDLVFASGAGLEEFLDPLIESAGVAEKVVHISDGINFLTDILSIKTSVSTANISACR